MPESLKLVYPPAAHETFEASTFLMGSIPKEHSLKIQNEPVDCSASGAFCHRVSLSPGDNILTLHLQDSKGNSTETLTHRVIRTPAYEAPDEVGLIEETLSIQAPLTLQPGDWLYLSFLATPGIRVGFHIPGLHDTPIMMRETSNVSSSENDIENRQGIFGQLHQTRRPIPQRGFYSGALRIPLAAAEKEYAITVHLHEKMAKKTIALKHPLHVIHQPQSFCIAHADAVIRTGPDNACARMTGLLQDTPVWVDGAYGNWQRIRYGKNHHGWLEQNTENTQNTLQETSLTISPPTPITLAHAHTNTDGLKISLPMGYAPVFEIETQHDQLRLKLYHAISQCDFIHEKNDVPALKHIACKQASDDVVELVADVDRLCGYDVSFENGNLILALRILPEDYKEWVILLDPGHGGAETGSIGPSGLPEKNLNLSFARILQKAFTQAGFEHIYLTRSEDLDVSLNQRSTLAKTLGAHIVLSLHHNALPDGRDPKEHQGISSYYYHGFSRQLAKHLQHDLVKNLHRNDYGILYDSLHMTRIPQAMSVLIELGFFTHPEEFDLLCNPDFQKKAANTLANSLKTF